MDAKENEKKMLHDDRCRFLESWMMRNIKDNWPKEKLTLSLSGEWRLFTTIPRTLNYTRNSRKLRKSWEILQNYVSIDIDASRKNWSFAK